MAYRKCEVCLPPLCSGHMVFVVHPTQAPSKVWTYRVPSVQSPSPETLFYRKSHLGNGPYRVRKMMGRLAEFKTDVQVSLSFLGRRSMILFLMLC